MRGRLLQTGVLLLLIGSPFAGDGQDPVQKKIIDSTAIRESMTWPGIYTTEISPNGDYILYVIDGEPRMSNTIIVEAWDRRWRKEISSPSYMSNASIIDDGRRVLFRRNDSLCLVGLGREDVVWLPHIDRYELLKTAGASRLVYTRQADVKELIIRDLRSGKEKNWGACKDFKLDPSRTRIFWQTANSGQGTYTLQWAGVNDQRPKQVIWQSATSEALDVRWGSSGETLVFHTVDTTEGRAVYTLHWYDTGTGKDLIIGRYHIKPEDYCFDKTDHRLSFRTKDSIWYCDYNTGTASLLVTKGMPGVDEGSGMSHLRFTGDGQCLRFNFNATVQTKPSGSGAKNIVWNYRDKHLRPISEKANQYVEAVIHIGDKKIIRLYMEDGQSMEISDNASKYALIIKYQGYRQWLPQTEKEYGVELVSLKDGTRRQLPIDDRFATSVVNISPHEDYIFYYDASKKNYFSYEIDGGKVRNLTGELNMSWQNEEYHRYYNSPNPFFVVEPFLRGIAGWVDGDSSILVYDSYDIWKLDPSGRQAPINMTRGYGRRHNIVLRLSEDMNDMKMLSSKKEWILEAFDLQSKYAGCFRKRAGILLDPEKIIMGPYSRPFVKRSLTVDHWLVGYSCPSAKLTLSTTSDLQSYTPLYTLQPQKGYNWYTSELLRWRLPDGDTCQGVLYKPENFDSSRKYPLLINYYEVSSDDVYNFWEPRFLNSCNIDVSYFASRGYLVFKPDIHFHIGHPGQDALAAIISGTKYLMARPYVDTRHMGIAGHSWGGFETNYVVTHSHLFAAAAEGAGPSDAMSAYHFLNTGDMSRHGAFEAGQWRMGATPWQRPDLYRANSPVYDADKVTTPLLILHNREDDVVSWWQGVEMFGALHRLGKKAWMLQYLGEGHGVNDPANMQDLTMRLTQYFDHYLKGAPAPRWMLDTTDNSLDLDNSGEEP